MNALRTILPAIALASLAATAGMTAGANAPETPETAPLAPGSVIVETGLWNWKQETNVAGIPLRETNTECLPPEKSVMSLTDLAQDLDKSCFVDNVAATARGYTFRLVCGGDYPGEARGRLDAEPTALRLVATGEAKVFGIKAPFSFQARADRIGQCQPDPGN